MKRVCELTSSFSTKCDARAFAYLLLPIGSGAPSCFMNTILLLWAEFITVLLIFYGESGSNVYTINIHSFIIYYQKFYTWRSIFIAFLYTNRENRNILQYKAYHALVEKIFKKKIYSFNFLVYEHRYRGAKIVLNQKYKINDQHIKVVVGDLMTGGVTWQK